MAQVIERLHHTVDLVIVRTLIKRANFVEKIRKPGRSLGQIDAAARLPRGVRWLISITTWSS
jgi:hypothetical protein